MALKLKPHEALKGIQAGSLQLKDGPPPLPDRLWSRRASRYKPLSTFQKGRYEEAVEFADLYLRKGMTVTEIADDMKLTHQRVCQILDFAVKYLCKTRHLVRLRRRRKAA